MGLTEHGLQEHEDAAEQAFEALRAEVAGLGRQLDALARQGEQGSGAITPDYSPTLGAMAKELQAVTALLAGIERHPALRMTPAEYAQQAKAGVREVENAARRGLDHAEERLRDTEKELQGLIGTAHEKAEQRRLFVATGALCIVVGMVLWMALIRVLPWGAGEWLAALPLGGDEWRAGERLMHTASPGAWDRMARLFNACPGASTTDLCEAAMAVRTIPPIGPVPAQPAPEATRGPAINAAPSPTRGKVGH